MKLEPTKNQRDLLQYIEDAGGICMIEHWMPTCTIASLIGRGALKVSPLKRGVKLKIQPQGYFMLDFKPPGRNGYFSNLHEVKTWRHR